MTLHAIYFLPFAVFVGLAAVSRRLRRPDMLVLLLVVTLACAVFAGARYDTDNDWESYRTIFDSIPPLSEGWFALGQAMELLYLESAFVLLVSLIKATLPASWIFLVLSVASLLIYFFSFKSVARYPAFAFVLYVADGFYLREFTQIRFGIAVALGFAAICAMHRGRTRRFWALAALAVSLHYTAFILGFLALWRRFVRSRRRIVTVSCIALALSLAGFFDNLVNILADQGLAPLRLLAYLDAEEESATVSKLIILGQFAILMGCAWSIREDDPHFFFVSVYALSFALVCVFSGFDLARRLSFFFSTALYVIASVAFERRRYPLLTLLIAYALTLMVARQSILREYATAF